MKRTYGLQVTYIRHHYGVSQIVARVLAREDLALYPINCSNDGEHQIWGAPKHLHKLMLNMLQVRAFFGDERNSRIGDPKVEFADAFYIDTEKATAMARTLTRIDRQLAKDGSPTEHGAVILSVIRALKLSWCVICTHHVPNSSYSQSQWMFTKPETAIDMFRTLIETHGETRQEA